MKTYKYKIVSLLLLLAISTQAQKFDKKISESFKVNSDVTIEINTANTDVDIETWNKKEVSIEAVIEVEGVSKKEAEKIFKNWKFEALANKNKVEINSLSDNSFFEFDGDFDFKYDFDFNFDFPESDIEISHFEMLEMPEMPEIDIEFEIEDFDYDAYKKDSSYLKGYKIKVAKQVEKFKNSDWKKKLDSVKNSNEYKKSMEELKKATKEITIEMKELRNSKEFKHTLEEAKRISEEVRKEMLENKPKVQIKEAKEAGKMAMVIIKKMKEEGKFDSIKNRSENVYFNFKDDKNSTIKIKKYIKIKVPKNATFDLNVKQGKLNVPNSNAKMSSNVSYGNFVGGIIGGARNELIFSNSSVVINTLNSGNVTLKNVPNATFGTFSNANLFANSSDVMIEMVGKDVALSQKFGSLEVLEIVPEFNSLNVILDYAKGDLNLSKANFTYTITGKKSNIYVKDVLKKPTNNKKNDIDTFQGFFKTKSSLNKLFVTGVYSTAKLN